MMTKSIRRVFLFFAVLMIGSGFSGKEILPQEFQRTVLFQDDFEDGVLDGWLLIDAFNNFIMGDDSPWQIISSGTNHYLKGCTHSFAKVNADGFLDGSIAVEFRLSAASVFHLNVRQSFSGWNERYFIGIHEGGIYLSKQASDVFYDLSAADVDIGTGVWHTVRVVLQGANIGISIDNSEAINYCDTDSPYLFGKVSIESTTDNQIHLDNIRIEGDKFQQPTTWEKTGGPSGGVGYDVRFHPDNPNIMFVTDNPSGVNKSYDGGTTWVQRNKGILSRSGYTGDDIPIFCLTIDPINRNVIWAGTQYNRGIYKSTNYGETWEKKDSGITEWNEITIRGFGVDPNNSNVVYAGAEITTGVTGYQFDKVKGKIFKTKDGGDSWNCVWEGDNLVRFVIVNPDDSNIVYASTGIFDREAYNDIGVGVLKSTDAGKTWSQANTGLTNLFVGYLEMHPEKPEILFAATGMAEQEKYGYSYGGIFKTADGGRNWKNVLKYSGLLNSVVISPSSPNIVYASDNSSFFRSEDGGNTWTEVGTNWGPPGIRPGSPIGMAVSPSDPMVVFANSYLGGNFKSKDGGNTWLNSSDGYTGASLTMIKSVPTDSKAIYAVGRSGTFVSFDGGYKWKGLSYGPVMNDSLCINIHPSNTQNLLLTDDNGEGCIYETTDGGSSWHLLYQYPGNYDSSNWHSFKAVTFSHSNPSIIYAGMRRVQNIGHIDPGEGPSHGMFKSSDGGQTWNQINNGLEETYNKSINDILIDPNDPEIVYIGTYKNGVWKTINGGALWACKTTGVKEITDVRSLAMHPVNHNIILAGTRENGIWRTKDGGSTWENISVGMPSNAAILSVAFYPPDPLTIFAADLTSGVFVSKNGGQIWYVMNDGLSNRAVTCLDIASNGSILYAATSGEGTFRLPLPGMLYVGKDDNTCDGNSPCYTSIQDAINAASSGAVLRLAQGTYNETCILSKSKSLTLQGGWDATFKNQNGTTILRNTPNAEQGSLRLKMLSIRPE